MTTETTTETPVSATQLAQAQSTKTEALAWLNASTLPSGDPERTKRVDAVIAAGEIIRRAADQARPQPAPTKTPAERVADIRARRETTGALMAEAQGTPLNAALLDQAIEQSAALHAGDAVPGAFTDADVRGMTRDAGLTDEGHALFGAALGRLGVQSGVERMQLAIALRDSPPEDEDALDEAEMARRVADWWGDGAEAEAKLAACDRAWASLTRAERLALSPRRGSRAFMEAMVKLGQRRAS
ncbi:MAG: hypothetical protein A2X36_00045 [Elusimicrobia bacterium GWA2_69_24]|nr:MAG: hypothetical protein A2W08_18595 [Candidatus Rokubacteria bacterium RBG_16_73_20]OGR58447.1 MAG: hypothetical protein A2X36_00045 [Elusimicrobia bacterium GWA2_69_24]HBH00972.1 hypothetical protein [Candidatus Rokubacteria bacterium]